MLFIVLIITLLFVRMKPRVGVYIWIYSFGLMCFSLALDGNWFEFWDYMYEYQSVENTPLVIYYYFVYFISFVLFFCVISNSGMKVFSRSNDILNANIAGDYWVDSRVRSLAVALAITSLMAGVYNLINAGPISLLLLDARAWEFSFGKNFITNYIYFLHLPALVMYGYLIGKKVGCLKDYLIVALLLFGTTWHGIKFTILHGFIFYLAGFYLSSRESVSSKMVNLILLLFGILLAFFVFVRGGGVEGFVSYITSPAINSMYYINNKDQLDIGSISNFNPLNMIPIDKFRERVLGDQGVVDGENERGFVLNDKYNLQSAITSINLFYGFGFLFYSFLFAVALNYIRSRDAINPILLYFYAVLLDTMLLLFTAFELFKTKLWTSLFVLFVVVCVLKCSNYLKFKIKLIDRRENRSN